MPFDPIKKYRENFENYPEFVRLVNANRSGLIATVIGAPANSAYATASVSGTATISATSVTAAGRYPGGVIPVVAAHTTSGTLLTQPVIVPVMKLVSVDQILTAGTVSASYAFGDTISLAGGTLSGTGTAALTVSSTLITSIAVNAAGGTSNGYSINDLITLAGGTSTVSGVVQVTGLALATPTIVTAGTGWNAGDTAAILGGAYFTGATSGPNANQALMTISTTKLVNISVGGGATGQNYKVNDTITLAGGTSSTAAIVTVLSVNTAGSITAVSITTAGSYTVNATSWAQTSTSGSGTGASFVSGLYGANTLTVTTAGNYTAVPAGTISTGQQVSSGGGTGLTVTATWGVAAVNIVNGGVYTSNSATFTQGSTTGTGTGATFKSAIFGILTVAISTAGTYLLTPGSGGAPVIQLATSGVGGGASFLCTWGVVSLNVNTQGTGTSAAMTLGFLVGPATLTNQLQSQGGTGADTTEDALVSYNLPGHTERAIGDGLIINAWGVLGSNGNTKTVNLYVGGLSGVKYTTSTQTGNGVTWYMELRATFIGQNQFIGYFTAVVGTTTITGVAQFFEQATGGTIPILITGTNATAQWNDVQCQGMTIRQAA